MSQASSFEWQMLELINQERTSRGVEPLVLDLRLNDSSEDHSSWMLNQNIFSHTGEGGSSARDRASVLWSLPPSVAASVASPDASALLQLLRLDGTPSPLPPVRGGVGRGAGESDVPPPTRARRAPPGG